MDFKTSCDYKTDLIHFSSRCNSINCHEENFSGSNYSKKTLDVVKDVFEDLLFRNAKVGIIIVWMRARVDNTVHVKI